jgi:transposase
MLEVLKMSQVKIKASRSYTRHSADYKKEALRLAEVHGVSKAASDLKLSESQIYAWRVQAQQAKSISEREQELSLENVKLKRLLAERSEEVDILKKAAAYFARSLK